MKCPIAISPAIMVDTAFSIAKGAAKLAMEIKKRVDTVQSNKATCALLSARMDSVAASLHAELVRYYRDDMNGGP